MTTPSNAELREAILRAFGVESDEQYVDNKAKFLIEDLLPVFQAREQQMIDELLGELPEKYPEPTQAPDGSIIDEYKLAFNIAISEVVSVIERLINTGKLDNSNPPTQKLDKSQNKTNDGGKNV